MAEILILVVLVGMVVVVLLLPIWTSRGKRKMSDSLARYQAIAEALLDSDLPRAREALKSLIRTNTEDIAAYLRLARILRKEGDLERSVALYRSLKARDIHERSLRQQVLAGLVEDLFLLGRYDEARAEVDGLKQLDKKNPLIWQVEVYEALAREDWGRAVKATDSLSRTGRGYTGPTQAQIRTYIAAKRAAAGEVRDARKLLEEALKDEPDYGAALDLLGDLWSRQDEHEKAAGVWKRLLRARPEAAPHV
ncbi:MAG: tetratricopeptide repeat protein, partial [Candidatus Eisenbacteria sp.]|nr:tetratricopeptide repeat protein [Candidatus Eisenbacteria bacterium]